MAGALQPILWHWSLSTPPENIRKPNFFWCFLGGMERNQWYQMSYCKYPNLVRTQVEIISDLNYLVRFLFDR